MGEAEQSDEGLRDVQLEGSPAGRLAEDRTLDRVESVVRGPQPGVVHHGRQVRVVQQEPVHLRWRGDQ